MPLLHGFIAYASRTQIVGVPKGSLAGYGVVAIKMKVIYYYFFKVIADLIICLKETKFPVLRGGGGFMADLLRPNSQG